MIHNDYQSILGAQHVNAQYLRAISAANGNYTITTNGTTYTAKPFRTFMSDGSAVVAELKAKSLVNPNIAEKVVTTQVIDSTTNALPGGVVYTLGDEWIFTSITVTTANITVNF